MARSLKISCPTVLNDMLENAGMTGAYPTTSPAMNIYHDWTMAMVWGGAESLKGWYVDDDDKVARINKRAQAFRRRVQRFSRSYGFGREFGGSNYAEDLYYAAVATLVDDGVVTK